MQQELFATFGMLVLMVLVFVGAYWASRFLAQRYQGGTAGVKNIKVLERIAVGKDAWLMLVQLQDKVCLLGVGPKEITLLKEFDGQEFDISDQPPFTVPSFAELLNKFREKGSGGHE